MSTGSNYQAIDGGRIGLRRLSEAGGTGPALLLFPHAGAQSLAFRALASAWPADWLVRALDPPGHGWAPGTPLEAVEEMARAYLKHLPREATHGVFLFGHSLGGLVALEVARRLEEEGEPAPGLILSGTRPPHRREDYGAFSLLSDRELLRTLVAIGGIPREWLDEPEVFDIFKDAIRADFRAFERYMPPRPLLATPTLALGGSTDRICRPEHVWEWSRYCPALEVDFIPGGHLFVIESAAGAAARTKAFIDKLGRGRAGERAMRHAN